MCVVEQFLKISTHFFSLEPKVNNRHTYLLYENPRKRAQNDEKPGKTGLYRQIMARLSENPAKYMV